MTGKITARTDARRVTHSVTAVCSGGTPLATKLTMRPILLSVVVVAGCVASTPLRAKDPWGWPVSTWQARHGNVLVLECVLPENLPDGIGMNDYVVSHGRKLQAFVEPPTRTGLVASHCERIAWPQTAPGAEKPPTAMIYTPSAEQLAGIHHHHMAAHHAANHRHGLHH